MSEIPGVGKIPLKPTHPDRICWGCDRYCAADDLGCAGGTIRTPHPVELFGEDWQEFFGETEAGPAETAITTTAERKSS